MNYKQNETKYRILPRERFGSDRKFHNLVDLLEQQIHNDHFTPTEVQEAAILAVIHYNLRIQNKPILYNLSD